MIFGLFTLLVGASRGAPAPSGSSDLSLTKTDSPDPVTTGGALAYSIQVANAGPDAATNAIVTDNLPKGVSFVSADSTQGRCVASGKKDHQKVTCALGTLASDVVGIVYATPGANPTSATVTIRVLAPKKAGTISNTAKVSSDLKDPNSKNNSATATTQVLAPAPPPTCDGHPATIVGTPGADVLVGSAGNDVIFSFGDNDLICAEAGNDLVKSEPGPTTYSGVRALTGSSAEETATCCAAGAGATASEAGAERTCWSGGAATTAAPEALAATRFVAAGASEHTRPFREGVRPSV